MLLVKLWFIALSRSALAAILSPTLIHRQTSTIGPLHPLSKRAPTTNLTEEDCQDWKVLRCLIRRDLSAPNLNETFESLQGDSAFRVIHLGLDHANDHFDFCTQIVQRFNQLLEARSRGVPAQRFHVTKLDHDVFGIYSRNPARSEGKCVTAVTMAPGKPFQLITVDLLDPRKALLRRDDLFNAITYCEVVDPFLRFHFDSSFEQKSFYDSFHDFGLPLLEEAPPNHGMGMYTGTSPLNHPVVYFQEKFKQSQEGSLVWETYSRLIDLNTRK